MRAAVQGAFLAQLSLPGLFALALAVCLVPKLASIEAFLHFTLVTENSFEPRLASALAGRFVKCTVFAPHHTRVEVGIGGVHTGTSFIIQPFATIAVQLTFFTFTSRPVLVCTLTFAPSL